MKPLGPLVILSGPSGSGKSTVIACLLRDGGLPLRLSVSATTRSPRPGEQDGVNYYFWTRPRFEEEIRAGAFLEYAEVYGNLYGTLRREVEPYREMGQGVILEIDIKGAAQIRRLYPDAVSIFLLNPSMEAYEQRLRKRGTETEAVIQRRLAAARVELTHAGDYQHQVINDDLKEAVSRLRTILQPLFSPREEHVG